MPNKDNSLKQFLELNTIFADVANNGLYLIRKEKPEYEAIIAPEELMDANTKDYYNIEGESHHFDRDVAKFWEKGGCTIVLVGVENQTSMDPNMVIRSMVYDAVGWIRTWSSAPWCTMRWGTTASCAMRWILSGR